MLNYEAALSLYRSGDFSAAVKGFLLVVAAEPRHTAAHYHLGLAWHALRLTDKGIAHYRKLLKKQPDYLDAWINLGDLYGKSGQSESAITAWQQALKLDADSVLVLNNLAITCSHLGRTRDAVGYYRQAAAIEPERQDLWFALGNAQMGLGHHDQAERAFRQALRIDPNHAQTHNNLAAVLGNLKREDESIAAYRQALVLDPDLADGLNNLALALYKRDERDEALALLRRCTDRHMDYALGWANLGMVLQGMGYLREAIAATDRALELNPGQPGWLWNQSLAYLTLGDFEHGWERFETRYAPERNDPNFIRPDLPFPMWQGEDLAGKRLLLVKEQGFGDQIQCLRFAKDLADRGATVDVWVHQVLSGLFATAPGVRQVMTEQPAEGYDCWAYLMSLPARLNAGVDTLPKNLPYLFADPEKSALAGRHIDAFARGRMKVALNWAGNPSHPNDHHRSLPVSLLASLLDVDQVAWISVQKDRGDMAETWVKSGHLLPLGDGIVDFTDTAALLANVDLLITVDSAVAHLAGAMGVRTWLLLPGNPDYRWMLERTNTPWYPSMRLWRQPTLGDWHAVLRALGRSLAKETGTDFPEAIEATPLPPPMPGGQPLSLVEPQRLIRGRHGWFVYNRHDQYVGQALEAYGEYAEFEVELFARLMAARPDTDLIEVGANMGSQSVPLSRLARQFYAFEPQPEMFQLLCGNLALNHCANARAFPVGASESGGVLHVPPVRYDQQGNFGGVGLSSAAAGTPVFVVTLDDYLGILAPELRVGLMKVDVEGMERRVLAGARRIIERDRPFLYVENDRIAESPALIAWMRQNDYRLYWHCPLLYNPDNFFRNPQNRYPGIAAINMLGIPNEMKFDTAAMTPVDADGTHILKGDA